MTKIVGYACNIRLSWLNEAVRMLNENLSQDEYKAKLNEYLSFEIHNHTSLRKAREILMNVWYYPSEELDPIRKEARNVLELYPDNSNVIHYMMLCLTYPVFYDVCYIIGKLFEFQDEFTNITLKNKIYDVWGERGTLESVPRRITLTLKDLGILQNTNRTRYSLNKIPVKNSEVVDFIIAQGMKLDGGSNYSYTELQHLNILFPFNYTAIKDLLLQSEKYTLGGFSEELTFSLKQ